MVLHHAAPTPEVPYSPPTMMSQPQPVPCYCPAPPSQAYPHQSHYPHPSKAPGTSLPATQQYYRTRCRSINRTWLDGEGSKKSEKRPPTESSQQVTLLCSVCPKIKLWLSSFCPQERSSIKLKFIYRLNGQPSLAWFLYRLSISLWTVSNPECVPVISFFHPSSACLDETTDKPRSRGSAAVSVNA